MAEGLVIPDHLNQRVGGPPIRENSFSSSPCLQSAWRDGRTLASLPAKREGYEQSKDGAPARRVVSTGSCTFINHNPVRKETGNVPSHLGFHAGLAVHHYHGRSTSGADWVVLLFAQSAVRRLSASRGGRSHGKALGRTIKGPVWNSLQSRVLILFMKSIGVLDLAA